MPVVPAGWAVMLQAERAEVDSGTLVAELTQLMQAKAHVAQQRADLDRCVPAARVQDLDGVCLAANAASSSCVAPIPCKRCMCVCVCATSEPLAVPSPTLQGQLSAGG